MATILACAHIGAVHSVVFTGFSLESLKKRINDSECSVIVTACVNQREGKNYTFKKRTLMKLFMNAFLSSIVIVVSRTNQRIKSNIWDIEYKNLISSELPMSCGTYGSYRSTLLFYIRLVRQGTQREYCILMQDICCM